MNDIIKIIILIGLIILDLHAIAILLLCEKIVWIQKIRKEDKEDEKEKENN